MPVFGSNVRNGFNFSKSRQLAIEFVSCGDCIWKLVLFLNPSEEIHWLGRSDEWEAIPTLQGGTADADADALVAAGRASFFGNSASETESVEPPNQELSLKRSSWTNGLAVMRVQVSDSGL